TLPKRLDSVAILGSCLIDLRQADIPPQGGRIEAVGIFGSVQILVPPGLNVRVNGVSILGSTSGNGDIVGDPAAPWVEIEAVAIFGSVEVKVSK
uniref:LiaF domain-containing protein n=1 Tax=Gracilinema caldarium TaxID=215591 RepID=UPI0026EC23E0